MFENLQNSREGDRPSCIIWANEKYKIYWDIIIVILLISVCIIIPYRIAFIQKEVFVWVVAFYVIDVFFLADMVITFFTTV
jgi:hypothetical protein